MVLAIGATSMPEKKGPGSDLKQVVGGELGEKQGVSCPWGCYRLEKGHGSCAHKNANHRGRNSGFQKETGCTNGRVNHVWEGFSELVPGKGQRNAPKTTAGGVQSLC